MAFSKAELQLQKRMRVWIDDPRIFVREVFGVIPDAWQDDVLAAFPKSQRIAMQACKGPGKTAVLTWLAWNFLLTRPFPKMAATSISGDNLSDNFWSEMSKWQQKSELLKSLFTWTKTRIFYNQAPENWWLSARTWPRSGDAGAQADTLAGLHADYIFFILDESGGIPDAVMASAEAALSSCKEGHIVQAGNPTHTEGPLYRAATSERHLWKVFEITGDPDDPKRSSRVHPDWARQQIEKYGITSSFVLVNVFGKFPSTSLNALIGPEEVRAAMKRSHPEHALRGLPKILGVDVAAYGDDSSVIAKRQGMQMFPFMERRNLEPLQGATTVIGAWNEFDADAAFIDSTGGWGSGWISHMQQLGKTPIGVNFAQQAKDSSRFTNMRAEIYWDLCDWIKAGGALPECNELVAALTQTLYEINKKTGRLQIQDKADIKAKLGYSPDHADAAALTFAFPVSPKARTLGYSRNNAVSSPYNPFADLDRVSGGMQGSFQSYDPFSNRG